MILEVHVAFLIAALTVLFGLTYSIGQFLNFKIDQAKANKEASDAELNDTEILTS